MPGGSDPLWWRNRLTTAVFVCVVWGAALATIKIRQSVSQEEVFGGFLRDLSAQTGGSVQADQLHYNIAEGTATLRNLSIRDFIQPGMLVRRFTADQFDLTFYRPAWYSEAILEDTLECHRASLHVHLLEFNRNDPPRVMPQTRFRLAPSHSLIIRNLRLLVQTDRLYRQQRAMEVDGIRVEWSASPSRPAQVRLWIDDKLWGDYYAEGWVDGPNQCGCLDIEMDGQLPAGHAGEVPIIGDTLEREFSASARFAGKLRLRWAPGRADLEGLEASVAFREFNVRYRSLAHVPVRMRGRVRFDKGIMDARLRGTAAGGTFRASGVISAIGDDPMFEVDVSVTGADIKQIFPVDAQSDLALGGLIDGSLSIEGKVAREAGITGTGQWHVRQGSVGTLPLMFDLRCRADVTVVAPQDADRAGPPGLILAFEADKTEIWDTRRPRPEHPFCLGKTQLTWKGPPGLQGSLSGRVTDPVWGVIDIEGYLDPLANRGVIELQLRKMTIEADRLASVPLVGERLSRSWSPRGEVSGQVILTRQPTAQGGLSVSADVKVHRMQITPRDYPGLVIRTHGDLVYRNGQVLGGLRGELAGGTFDASCHTHPDARQPELRATVAFRDVDLSRLLRARDPQTSAGLGVTGSLRGKVEMLVPLEELQRVSLQGKVAVISARLAGIPMTVALKGRAHVAMELPKNAPADAPATPRVRLHQAQLEIRGDTFRETDPSLKIEGVEIAWDGPSDGRGKLHVAVRDPNWGHYDINGDLDLGQKTGTLDIDIIDGRMAKGRISEVPVVGAVLDKQWRPSGRFRGKVRVTLGRGQAGATTRVDGQVEIVELRLRDKMLPHSDVTVKGTLDLHGDRMDGRLTGTVAGGDLDVGFAIYQPFGDGRFVMTVHFENVQLAQLGDPKERAKDGGGRCGLLTGGVELTGPLDDPDQATGPGWIRITKADLWRVPVFGALFRALGAPSLDPGAIGEGRLWFDAHGETFRVRRGVFRSATVSLHCEGGEVGFNQRLFLTVHAWARGLEATGVPGLEQVMGALRDVVLSHLIELRVRGTLSEPEVQVVPVKIISDAAFGFFRGVLGSSPKDDAGTRKSR